MLRFPFWTILLSTCLYQCCSLEVTNLYPNFVNNGTLHDKLYDSTLSEETVIFLNDYQNVQTETYLLFFEFLNNSTSTCKASMIFCYFTRNPAFPAPNCGKSFTEIKVTYENSRFTMSGCNQTRSMTGNGKEARIGVDHRDLGQSNYLIMYVGDEDYSELWYCQRISLVDYLDKRNAQTVVKFLKDPQCDIFEVKFNSELVKDYGTLVKRLTTTTEPPTTPETTTGPPLPLEPLPMVVYLSVGCFCATCIIASIIICGISSILRNRRYRKQEELFYTVLRRHYAEQKKLNASAGKGKTVGMLTEEAFMANVKKVMEEDKIKEEISAVGDEAATPETFVKFMSLEPLYRRSQTRELIENSSVTCADSVTTTTQTPSRKKTKEAKSKMRTADMIQPPSSDNEWLQLSNKSMTPDILSNEAEEKDIDEYNALSQSTWEERVGELDSLIKIIKADLKAHGIKLNASAQTTPTSDVQSWLQSTTSLHRFIADCSVVLSPTVFKLRYKEQMNFLEEQKLAALYRSALLSVEKQHRIAFLQMVFHKFALLQKTTKQAPSTIKRSHPYPLLDRLRHHFPEYFAVFAKSNEK